jgi:diadenosine tetraphosphate (Ap4A) HIT family hydrolase
MNENLIFETENFEVKAAFKPHVTRSDGGHIVIFPKVRVLDRTKLSPELAVELMRLTLITGEAFQIAMNNRGIDVGRINYQDSGNWSVNKPEGPYLHIQLYGRAKSAKIQKWGESLNLPLRETHPEFYEKNEPLNEVDIKEIKKQTSIISKKDKYNLKNWSLK